jgi:ribose transport system permease protein
MTGIPATAPPPPSMAPAPARSVALARIWLRDRPLVPLLVLLGLLVVVLERVQPGIVNPGWISNTIRFAIPLAILAACQTLAMLTGGIDLSVATVASMAAYVMATQVSDQGWFVAILIALALAALVGLVNGIGVGIFRVHPLIMTLSMGLVVFGLVNIYARLNITGGTRVPEEISFLGSQGLFGFLPVSLILFIPLAALVLVGLRRFGYGRLLFAVGDNPVAARLAGVRVWQVHLVLYVISGFLAGLAGLIFAGVIGSATGRLVDPYLLPSVAAAVIGGTSIFGGRGGYAGSIVGALILTVLTTLLSVLQSPEAIRQVLFGAIILAVAAAYTRITEEG